METYPFGSSEHATHESPLLQLATPASGIDLGRAMR